MAHLVEPGLVAVVMVVGTVADMYPEGTATVMFQDALVEVQVVHYPIVPLACRVQVRDMQIGRTAIQMLRVLHAMDCFVEQFTAVAAVDADGVADVVAQWLQHLATQLAQVYHHVPQLRCVVNTQTAGRLTLYEFTQSEVPRELCI